MSLIIASLNSGSNGNCYYVGNDKEAVFIDVGISCREIEKRMKRLELNIKKVKAVFISHEHKDHITGLVTLSKKFQLPVYITAGTHRHARVKIDKDLVNRFNEDEHILIGDLKITAFSKFHDAEDPHSFTIESGLVKVGVFTDIGQTCKKLIHHFRQCHAAFLEANYDEDMLMNGDYPYYLKKRISDGKGHLSNDEALNLFKKHRPAFMSHLILSHLSKINNEPELVRKLFIDHAKGTEIIVASRDNESEVFYIQDKRKKQNQGKINTQGKHKQLTLF